LAGNISVLKQEQVIFRPGKYKHCQTVISSNACRIGQR